MNSEISTVLLRDGIEPHFAKTFGRESCNEANDNMDLDYIRNGQGSSDPFWHARHKLRDIQIVHILFAPKDGMCWCKQTNQKCTCVTARCESVEGRGTVI